MQNILVTEKSHYYELLDSGEGEKLERYGEIILSRPDPQALWPKSLSEDKWKKAHAVFERTSVSGKWKPNINTAKEVSEKWNIFLSDLTFSLKLLPSKHVGVFPEQAAQWKWLQEKIQTRHELRMGTNDTNRKIQVLNLFAYTGGATLACTKAGAEVVHVDSSEFAVGLAKENAKLSGLEDAPIRFIVDDVRKFVEREIKRGHAYDIILLDPPVYGKGTKKEVWNIEKDFLPLLTRVKSILSKDPIAVVINGYASGYSHITYAQMLETVTKDLGGQVSSGELAIRESSDDRLLPSGIFARWEQNQ